MTDRAREAKDRLVEARSPASLQPIEVDEASLIAVDEDVRLDPLRCWAEQPADPRRTARALRGETRTEGKRRGSSGRARAHRLGLVHQEREREDEDQQTEDQGTHGHPASAIGSCPAG